MRSSDVSRKGKEGKAFLGCSTFPKCRHTKSV
ncbi:topoisomerase DNA-binding C4 zinc finger domain-containing protein [Paenibacillus sp. N3.4]|nr:topoisomerase DNA-binding C4 zinc finger domain-containing protein [Paenibacillus sp. N3.4]